MTLREREKEREREREFINKKKLSQLKRSVKKVGEKVKIFFLCHSYDFFD